MFSSKPVFLHVGFPKTGTTALQRNVLQRCAGTRYSGKPGVDPLVRDITDLDDPAWEAQLEATFRRTARLFCGPEGRVVLSDEELVVGSLHGSARPDTICGRLHLLFPQATVLIVLRSQLTLLCSLYGYAMTMPGTPTVSFDTWLDGLRSASSAGRGLHLFNYDAAVDHYVRRFGRDRVEVLFHEDFVASPAAFIADVAGILGVDTAAAALLPNPTVNGRPSRRLVQAIKLAERHPWAGRAVAALPAASRERLAAAIGRGPALATRYSADTMAHVSGYYAASNARLAARHGLELARRGYPVA